MAALVNRFSGFGIGRFFGRFRKRKVADVDGKPNDRRLRILLWAVVITLLCGYVEAGEPLEEMFYGARDAVRARNSDGAIVVVGMDDQTVQKLGHRYFPRRHTATVVDQLFSLGAKRVFFDVLLQDSSSEFDDKKLAEAFARHKGSVFLASMLSSDPRNNGKLTPVEPSERFKRVASLVDVTVESSPFYGSISHNLAYGDVYRPTMAGVLSETWREESEFDRPDFAIRVSSIPTISFVDVLDGKVPAAAIAGKDIVIGGTSQVYNDIGLLVFQGNIARVYGHVIAGETFKRGNPIDIGWLPAWLVGFAASILILFARQRQTVRLAITSALILFCIAPILLDEFLVTVNIFAGVLLFSITSFRGLSARRVLETALANSASGLPNLLALRSINTPQNATLIAMKIRNYAAIAASFEKDMEREIVLELKRRIDFGSGQIDIYHADDTLFWFTEMEMGAGLAQHLEGLKAIANSAFLIGSRTIDLQLAFGIDSDFERPLSSRVGSASMCAQEAARNNEIWKFYDPQRQHEAAWQLSLIGQLERAIDNNELWIAYQPKLDLAWNRIIGAEALVRWTHPERGTVGPDEFIIAAETHNRIDKLTAFVLDRALSATNEIHYIEPNFTIAVNLSAQLLESPTLINMVQAAIRKNRFPADKLVLEITETAHLARSKIALSTMAQFRAMGIHLSVDDYGTGNATMDYLKLLPSDEVKIDRSFVSGICSDAQDRIMVQSTIKMVHDLGRRVVAEGVETQDVMDQLRALGCDMVQGYLVGKPVPLGVFIQQLPDKSTRLAG